MCRTSEAEIATNKSHESDFHPLRWPRSAAVWLVYVPRAQIAGHLPFHFRRLPLETILTCFMYVGKGGFTALLVPCLNPAFKHAHKDAIAKGEALKTSRLEANVNLEKIVSVLLHFVWVRRLTHRFP